MYCVRTCFGPDRGPKLFGPVWSGPKRSVRSATPCTRHGFSARRSTLDSRLSGSGIVRHKLYSAYGSVLGRHSTCTYVAVTLYLCSFTPRAASRNSQLTRNKESFRVSEESSSRWIILSNLFDRNEDARFLYTWFIGLPNAQQRR
jgi:hypothetical protein